MNILLGVTGSVATIKLPELYSELSELGEVKVVLTRSAHNIVDRTKNWRVDYTKGKLGVMKSYGPWPPGQKGPRPEFCVFTEESEWQWKNIGDPVLHIDLKDWADILVIAPLTANTLAKMAYGLADNLLTCICRAWPAPKFSQFGDLTHPSPSSTAGGGMFSGGKPIVVAPAMNTDMWEHPHTMQAIKTLWGIYGEKFMVVQPVEKKLACGTTGMGALAPVSDIVKAVQKYVS